MKASDTVALGRGPVRVSRLGFGTTALAGMFRETPEDEAAAAIAAALQAGIRHFDTAPQYGAGLAETRLGAALRGVDRSSFVISTKIGKLIRPPGIGTEARSAFVGMPPHSIVYDYSHDGVLRSLDDSLARLGTDRVDIVLIHDVNRRFHGEAVMERCDEALAGACVALRRLRDEGVIGAYGSASQDVDVQLRFVREADPDCLMLPGRQTLLDRAAEPVLLPLCLERGIGVMLAAPFESGILATGRQGGAMFAYQSPSAEILHRVARIEGQCEAHGIGIAAAALQFPLRHPAITNVVVGMRSRTELELNVAALEAPVPETFWNTLTLPTA